jgi:hypothetical protein
MRVGDEMDDELREKCRLMADWGESKEDRTGGRVKWMVLAF